MIGAWGAMSQFHPPDEARAVAAYIAAMADDLEKIARHHGLTTLGYLLTIAKLEAEEAASETAEAQT
jgi:hypothetical protein